MWDMDGIKCEIKAIAVNKVIAEDYTVEMGLALHSAEFRVKIMPLATGLVSTINPVFTS
jgi:hypothetical protein